MTVVSKVVLGISVVLTIGSVVGVHIKQNWDRERLREGVLRDLERLERKRKNLQDLEDQIKLTKVLVADRERRETQTANSAQGS